MWSYSIGVTLWGFVGNSKNILANQSKICLNIKRIKFVIIIIIKVIITKYKHFKKKRVLIWRKCTRNLIRKILKKQKFKKSNKWYLNIKL